MLQLLPVGVALGAPSSQVAIRPFGGIRLVDWAHLLIRFVFVISDIHQPCTVLLRGRRTRPPSSSGGASLCRAGMGCFPQLSTMCNAPDESRRLRHCSNILWGCNSRTCLLRQRCSIICITRGAVEAQQVCPIRKHVCLTLRISDGGHHLRGTRLSLPSQAHCRVSHLDRLLTSSNVLICVHVNRMR